MNRGEIDVAMLGLRTVLLRLITGNQMHSFMSANTIKHLITTLFIAQ